jgi:hypothetical protein
MNGIDEGRAEMKKSRHRRTPMLIAIFVIFVQFN